MKHLFLVFIARIPVAYRRLYFLVHTLQQYRSDVVHLFSPTHRVISTTMPYKKTFQSRSHQCGTRTSQYDYEAFAEPLKSEECIWNVRHKHYQLNEYKNRSFARIKRKLDLESKFHFVLSCKVKRIFRPQNRFLIHFTELCVF